MSKKVLAILLALCSLCFGKARASHIVGGEMTYEYIKDSVIGTPPLILHIYIVHLTIYEDCLTGSPDAIAADNPGYLAAYDLGNSSLVHYDSAFVNQVRVPINFSNSCVANIPNTCLEKRVFSIRFALKENVDGYVIDNQRCCRNGSINNIVDPSDAGSTFFCIIPARITNNSAVFKNFPAQIICDDNPLAYDNSATDADGDSLSYGFYAPLNFEDGPIVKPTPPTFPDLTDSVSYRSPYSSHVPFTGYPAIQINPRTGLITGTPNLVGRFLVGVYCNEYRDGILINTIRREFQYVVTPCTKVVVADIPQYSSDFNTYLVNCENYSIHFVNTSTGGFAYHWDFGMPGTVNDTSSDFEPTFSYTDSGTYLVKLIVNPNSTCPDSISRYVKVYPKFHAAFADSGMQCPGGNVYFIDKSTATIKPIVYWKWNFGDGDSSFAENPNHSFKYGGTYNVTLISENVKDCIDTVVQQVIIDNFKPFAGNDTFIVKGEYIQFNATGGTQYAWTPATNLNDTSVYNPIGSYPDVGNYTYYVHVISPYGCQGDDTITVDVVNQAAFFVPNAFSPDGDGHNDEFKPIAIGYKTLNYFRIFNRWGNEVFYSNNLETGWDGTYKGVKVEMGTYYWEMTFTDRFGKQAFLKGDVLLMR